MPAADPPPLDPARARLLDEAIDLMMRLQNAPDNGVTQQTIRNWCARSGDHERIWQRVTGAHGLSGLALRGDRRGVTRRTLMLGGAAGLGAGLVAYNTLPGLRLRLSADHITRTAEVLPLNLADGSRVILGPDSALAFADNAAQRQLNLLRGMGWFDITEQSGRPFALLLDGGYQAITATAAFEAAQEGGQLSLMVARGQVALTQRGRTAGTLQAGDWLRMGGAEGREAGRRDTSLAATWATGQLLADAEPLEAVVTAIGRWLPGYVVIADQRLGRVRISGLFDLSDPGRALDAAVRPTGARIRRIGGLMTVISRA